jgi:hypothetical protein
MDMTPEDRDDDLLIAARLIALHRSRFVLADETNAKLIAITKGPAEVKSGETFEIVLPPIVLD